LRVREVECASALQKTRLEGIDYALNPYLGCTHACTYCYSPHIIREKRTWGKFLDVRINMPHILARELKRMPRGTVGVGTVTDPYQPAEGRYRITRYCLELLRRHSFPVSIQTKSDLVVRDLDILGDMEAEVGFTITALDRRTAALYQPGAPSPDRVLDALQRVSGAGVATYVFIGPILPGVSTEELLEIVKQASRRGASRIYADALRIHGCERFSSLPDAWRCAVRDGYGRESIELIEQACRGVGVGFSSTVWKD